MGCKTEEFHIELRRGQESLRAAYQSVILRGVDSYMGCKKILGSLYKPGTDHGTSATASFLGGFKYQPDIMFQFVPASHQFHGHTKTNGCMSVMGAGMALIGINGSKTLRRRLVISILTFTDIDAVNIKSQYRMHGQIGTNIPP